MIVRNPERTTIVELIPERPAVAAMFSDMLGRPATVDDFDRELLADFRDYLTAAGYRQATQNHYTMMIRRAWRRAFECQLTTVNPGAPHTWFSTRPKAKPAKAPKQAKPPKPKAELRPIVPTSPTMAVLDYLPYFFTGRFKGKSNDCQRTYRNAVARLRDFLEVEPTLQDLRHETFARWVKWCKGLKKSRSTWRSNVQRLRTIWRAAYADGLTQAEPPDIHSWDSGLPPHKPYRVERKPGVVEMTPEALKPGEKPANPEAYIPYYVLERGISRSAQRNLRHRLNQFATAIGRPVEWADFEPMTVNAALAKELARGLSPETVRGMRCGILSLWRAAYEAEILDHQPGRIRKIKITARLPQCWTMAQLATLSRAIDELKGHMKNAPSVSRKDFWRAFVSLGYYTGLRLGDLMKLNWQQHIGDDGSVNIVMGKTGDLLTTRLPDDCLARLEPLKAAGLPLVFSDILNQKNLQFFFRRILRSAGLPGSVKWLRRTGASHLEAIHRGAAKDHLGHRTHGLAYKHYVDPRVVQQEKPLPPRIDGGDA